MEQSEIQSRIADLERQIAALPAGSITKKTVNGRQYLYHRWTEDKKRREKFIPLEEVDAFRTRIEQRKALEKELKDLRGQLPRTGAKVHAYTADYATNVRTGRELRAFAAPIRGFKKRACFRQLRDYLYGGPQDKVLFL